MNEKVNLSNLIETISFKTQQDPEVVKNFVVQLFKEIEKELIASSFVNIEGLGIFRIIKSLPSDRILYLSGFKYDKIAKTKTENDEGTDDAHLHVDNQNPENIVPDKEEINDSNTWSEISNSHSQYNDNEYEELQGLGAKELTGFNNYPTNQNTDDDLASSFLDEYENHKNEELKRKKSANLRIVILLLVTIAGLALLLFLLYPKQTKDNLSAPPPVVSGMPNYTMLENNDTINYLCKIIAESELDFASLALEFYGYETFWPYIFKANENEVSNAFEIKTGTVIVIPRLDNELIDRNNKFSVDKANAMINEIIRLKGNTVMK